MDVQTYNNPGGIIAGTVITEGIAVLCVGLRFYARYSKKQSYITSDWLILVALIMGAGLAFIEIYGMSLKKTRKKEATTRILFSSCHSPQGLRPGV